MAARLLYPVLYPRQTVLGAIGAQNGLALFYLQSGKKLAISKALSRMERWPSG
jgi:hypothetical protein